MARPVSPFRLLSVTCLLLASCSGRAAVRQESPTPVASILPARVLPLPGGLDDRWMLQSNTPELIEASGLVLATWKGRGETALACLDHPLTGSIRFFSHHVFSDEAYRPGARRLELAWVARAAGSSSVRLQLTSGASYLSQPEAPFVSLPALVTDGAAQVHSGPGDRVARDLLLGSGNLAPAQWRLDPGGALTLLATRSVPTDVPILPARNGRTTSLDLRSDGPVDLAEVAWVGDASAPCPDAATWMKLALEGPVVLPREVPATPEEGLPGVGFRYGRVGGVARGQTWQANLPVYEGQERLAFPIASVWRQRFGTSEVQSAELVARLPGSAYRSHGNYQVEYDLGIPVSNPARVPRTYRVSLLRPLDFRNGGLVFQDPPHRMVFFRGAVAWEVSDASGRRSGLVHLQFRGGEHVPPFLEIPVAPGSTVSVRVRLVMPADATPPQALVLEADGAGEQAVR
jgi:hypothetical protein